MNGQKIEIPGLAQGLQMAQQFFQGLRSNCQQPNAGREHCRGFKKNFCKKWKEMNEQMNETKV